MKIGDFVEWTSQSGGSTKKKTGEVIGVVPPWHNASLLCYVFGKTRDQAMSDYNIGPIDSGGNSRNHESYLISVKTGKTDAAKKTIYWPRVSALKRVTP